MAIGIASLQLGLSRGSLEAQIRALFLNAEQGVWYDPSDFSSMYQDSAGATPVTAVGQPVGKILDKSGRGNHATQATAASRPTLQQDASGKYYLNFDGVDDWLGCAAASAGAKPALVVAGVRHGAGAAEYIYAEQSSTVSSPIACQIQGVTGAPRFAMRDDAGTAAIATGAVSEAGANYVMTGYFSTPSAYVAANGVSQGTATGSVGATTLSYGTIGASRSAGGAATAFITGRIYSLIIRGAASSASQIAAAERYCAGKAGVTL